MLNSFIIVLREGFESFLLVAVILAYLKKSGQSWLNIVVYIALALGLSASAGLGYLLATGVDDARTIQMFGETAGGYINHFFANEALREAVLGLIAMLMVGTLVIHMWRTGPKLRERMHERLNKMSSRRSRIAAVAGVFLFTFLMITREGMETALMLSAGARFSVGNRRSVRTCLRHSFCARLDTLLSPDQLKTVLPGHGRLPAAVHDSGRHLLLP